MRLVFVSWHDAYIARDDGFYGACCKLADAYVSRDDGVLFPILSALCCKAKHGGRTTEIEILLGFFYTIGDKHT
jgi:hypothetical protein